MNKKNNKGFTLMEMLIVVALIAILVVISIPVFTAQLEKAREATDLANMRGAKALAVASYLVGDDSTFKAGTTYAYDAENGKFVAATAEVTPYGKGTASGKYSSAVADQVFYVQVSTSGDVTAAWAAPKTALPALTTWDKAYK